MFLARIAILQRILATYTLVAWSWCLSPWASVLGWRGASVLGWRGASILGWRYACIHVMWTATRWRVVLPCCGLVWLVGGHLGIPCKKMYLQVTMQVWCDYNTSSYSLKGKKVIDFNFAFRKRRPDVWYTSSMNRLLILIGLDISSMTELNGMVYVEVSPWLVADAMNCCWGGSFCATPPE